MTKMNANQSKRLVRDRVDAVMQALPVTFLSGPRQSGKTTFLEAMQNEGSGKQWRYFNLDDPSDLDRLRSDAMGEIRSIPAESVIAIDEAHLVPELFPQIKYDVFKRYAPGRYLLTGSANPAHLSKIRESLAGRMGVVRFHPLSVCEKLDVKPSFLKRVLKEEPPRCKQAYGRDFLLDQMVAGGFPVPSQMSSFEQRTIWQEEYIARILGEDMLAMEKVAHNDELELLLESTMAITGRLVNYSSLARTVSVSDQTVRRYLVLLEAWHLLDRVAAWSGNVQRRLRKQRKLHYLDTGLVCSRLGLDQEHIQRTPSVRGQLVETFVYSELRKLISYLPHSGSLRMRHYRDNNGLEIDIIIERPGGYCFAFEVKGGVLVTQKDYTRMKAFKDIAGDKFRMGIILHDGEEVHQFGEGLYTVPLSALWS